MTWRRSSGSLKEIAEAEKLAADDVEAEFFSFYYTREYQARIYNDFIALQRNDGEGAAGSGYMTKLAISHALAPGRAVRRRCSRN